MCLLVFWGKGAVSRLPDLPSREVHILKQIYELHVMGDPGYNVWHPNATGGVILGHWLARRFANKPTRHQSVCRLVNWQIRKLTDWKVWGLVIWLKCLKDYTGGKSGTNVPPFPPVLARLYNLSQCNTIQWALFKSLFGTTVNDTHADLHMHTELSIGIICQQQTLKKSCLQPND